MAARFVKVCKFTNSAAGRRGHGEGDEGSGDEAAADEGGGDEGSGEGDEGGGEGSTCGMVTGPPERPKTGFGVGGTPERAPP